MECCCASDQSNFEIPSASEVMYYPLYSGWQFPQFPYMFRYPTEAACWAISRFKRDGLGNVWDPGDYPFFLQFVGRLSIPTIDMYGVSLPCNSAIEHQFFEGVRFYHPKKECRLLKSDYVKLCPDTFHQCIQGFRKTADYLLSANSIYMDKGKCCCRFITLNRVRSMYNNTLSRKLSLSAGFIRIEAPFKYIKENPNGQKW